jgi:O-antigen ligase
MRESAFRVMQPAVLDQPAAPRPASATRTPRFLFFVVALTIGSSFYVNNEPAPTDLLFLLLLLIAPFYRGFGLRFDMNPILTLSISVFLFCNLVSIWICVINKPPGFEFVPSTVYLAVTAYLFLFWYTISMLIRSYGLAMINLIQFSFFFATCVAALAGILLHMGLVSHAALGLQASGMRITGTFKDPNVYGAFLGSGLAWLFISLLISRKLFLLKVGLLGFVLVGMVGGFSRGAFVNVAVSIITFFALRSAISLGTRWLKRFTGLILVAALVGAPMTWWYLRDTGLEEFFSQRLELQRYDDKRFGTQLEALGRLDESPFGVGPGQAATVLGQNTHNLYVNVAFEYGVLGGVSFYLFVLTTIWIGLSGVLRRGPYAMLYASFLAILTGILVNSIVIDTLHWRHLFLFLALPVGLDRYERSRLSLVQHARPAFEMAIRQRPSRRPTVDQVSPS